MTKIKDNPYLRIGTDFFKITKQPFASKDLVKIIIRWNLSNIRQDHKTDYQQYIEEMEKFDGFCFVPDNINYQRSINGYYNNYEPIPHKPKEGKFDNIEKLLRHIFGEQYEIGLDYLQLIYHKPLQILPILCLVSYTRETGKTTFLNLLKDIFAENMTINSTADFRNQFNSGWISKLIIGCEEVQLEKKEDQEKLKTLSTGVKAKSEAKNKDKVEVEIYAKFILLSNYETTFIKIDQDETRYWVRKIPKPNFDDPKLKYKMKSEIPAFLHFLLNREMKITESQSRMWFLPEQLHTEALDRLKKANKTSIESNIQIMLTELYEGSENNSEGFLTYTQKDLRQFYREFTNKPVEPKYIKELLHETWKLESTKPQDYWKVLVDGRIEKDKGRYYTIDKSLFLT